MPTGYAPVVDNIFTGLWYMAASLAMYFVPTQGSGMIGELLAAIVEMAIGGQWAHSLFLKVLFKVQLMRSAFSLRKNAMKDFLGRVF